MIEGILEEGDLSSEETQGSQGAPPPGEGRPGEWVTRPWTALTQSWSWSGRSLAERLLSARMLPWLEALFLLAMRHCLEDSLGERRK